VRRARFTVVSSSLLWTLVGGAVAQAQVPATVAPTTGGPERPAGTPHPVVPPGQDEVLSDMLGRGVELPGPCKYAGAEAAATLIRSSYECPKGKVVYELVHPSNAKSNANKTEKFALSVQSGSPPAGLTEAIVAHVRAREAAFDWQWVGTVPTP
jgi:hypothetical protein